LSFFSNDPVSPEIYTLSLHDALPIFPREKIEVKPMVPANLERFLEIQRAPVPSKIPRLLFAGRLCSQKNLPLLLEVVKMLRDSRSEEHTSELQSRFDLVCRLLLEKKK